MARKTITAPAALGTLRRSSQSTIGDATEAMIPAVIRGPTIVFVNPRISTAPASAATTPNSSHAVNPRSRSHPGAANRPVNSPGSISTNSDSSSGPGLAPRWRRSRRRSVGWFTK